ncbi:MAG TPA: glycosyltransferase family 4 protein [Solirubrobacteraceae bacterium]|nr:glycosyltransferase family 4 protein [Solirubrobacteraceae bacterium]
MDESVIRVAQFPPVDPSQPASFPALLERATEAAGIHAAHTERLRTRWALRQRQANVVHLHWLEYIVTVEGGSIGGWVRTLVRTTRLLASLLVLRTRGVGIIWTVHNLMPHEASRPRIQRFIAHATYLLCDEVIVHSDYAAARVRTTFRGARRRSIHVIPHANYVGAHPPAAESPDAFRDRLGVPRNAYVYLCFGQIRRYKRLTHLAEAFGRLPDEDARLLIVGNAVDSEEAARLDTLAAKDPRILLRPGHVPDELVASIHAATDAAVIAYRDVFSSGALMLALSHGVPVVAPRSGTVSELFAPPAVEFFDGSDDDLRDALTRVRSRRGPEQAEAALRAAHAHSWSEAGRRTALVYRLARNRHRRPQKDASNQ